MGSLEQFKEHFVFNKTKHILIMQVTDGNKLSVWLEKEFLPNIYSQPWYNGIKEKEDVYIESKASLLIGMPWMRQLRIQKGNYCLSFFPLGTGQEV